MKLATLLLLALPGLATGVRAGAVRTVASLDGLASAVQGLGEGDTLLLADGDYTTTRAIVVEGRRGTLEQPIVVRAEHRGRATIGGRAGFVVRYCEHLRLEGFTMSHDADEPSVLLENCRNVRVSRNHFRLSERASPRHMEHWVYVIGASSASNRVDHNLFARKTNAGSHVFVRGDDASLTCSQHDRIDHNHFRDVVFANDENGHETIRTGSNDLGASGRSSLSVIESNLLERCSGEGEVMSIKSSDNIVRGNTLVDCRGAICLRLGNRNEVSGNFVLCADGGPGCGGVKLYGFDHRVFNNYFLGLTGARHEAPLALVPGTLDTPATTKIGKQYDSLTTVPPTRAWIAFNTWIDCAPLQFGFRKDRDRIHIPDECTFVNNLVVRTKPQRAPLVNLELVHALRAHDNLGFDGVSPLSDPWVAWFRREDPRLRRADQGDALWRLTQDSPAINAAAELSDAPRSDLFGRPRSAPRDIGAEEYGQGASPHGPLTPADVGPDSDEAEAEHGGKPRDR